MAKKKQVKTRALLLQMYTSDNDIESAMEFIIRNNKNITTSTGAMKYMCREYIGDKYRLAINNCIKELENKNIIDTEIVKEKGD